MSSNWFPESWIGKEPVKVGDGGVYYLGNDSTKQIFLPSGYKGLNTEWLNNGVLRIDTNINNTKLFYVGCQRYFEAYQNEAEPHDRTRYEEAVKECQRLRAEEAKRNSFGHNTKNNGNSSHAVVNNRSKKNSNSGIGTILGEAGALFASAKKAAKEFKSIGDSSDLEAFLNNEFQNQIERQQKQMAESHRRAAKIDKRMQSNAKRREKELNKLRALEQKFIARENKKTIFSNLHAIFSRKDDIMIIPDEIICKYSGISSPNHKAAVSRVMKGYRQCLKEVGSSEKFIQCWSEIIYLIEEGFLFKDKHVEQFVKNISNICGQMKNDVSKDISDFNDCLKMCYSQLKDAYWGYNFEKNPKEDIIKKRINYLSNTLFFEEDMDENVEFQEAYDLYEDEDNQFNDIIECTNDENADEEDDIEYDEEEDDEDDEEEEEDDEDEDSEEKNIKRPESSYDNHIEDKKTLSAGKYSDLECIGFSKDNSTEDFKEPKNFLDIITKNNNKKIAKKKEKWNDALWNLDHRLKESVLKDLLHIEKDINKFLKLEEEKNNLTQNGHTSGFFGLGGSKELKKVKTDIKEIKEIIEKEQTNLAKSLRELRYCERGIKDIQEELFELTKLEKYADFTPLEGNGISIVEQLVKCKKITDTETLRNIFEL